MAFTKYILPTLAIAGSVLAQCNGPSITIQTNADAATIASCQTYKGDVIIASTASGTIEINGVQQITGNLVCKNATQLTAITSDQLNSIGGTWLLHDLTILSTLQFNSLTSVNNIEWIGLPALQGLNFDQGVQKANNIYISNTQLNTLAGIELKKVNLLDVNNNYYLSSVNVDDLTNVTTALSFAANAKGLEISFPSLEVAGNMTFRNTSTVSVPALSEVLGDMGFYSSTASSFKAPNLTLVESTVAFVDSPYVNTISMPILKEIGGGFLIANNTNLDKINGFPKLEVIVGALDFAGVFNSVSLPALKDVRGGSNVQTTSNNEQICELFDQDHANGIIKGVNTCLTDKANPDTNPSATSGGTSSTSGSNAAAPGFDPSAPLTGLSALIAALLMI